MEPIRRVTAPTLDVLDALLAADGPAWGLLVIKATGRQAGTVYPILERLERQGWITSSWDDETDRPGPRRRLYEFTPDGVDAARDLVAARPSAATPVRPARSAHRPVTS
ncbi:PadR family transcriptional regulator [Curtobacterium flaccumfaciens pv. oortii]|uniref:PadR family transcriptional regulator n=1 Tax=Curtobacterium flaccumfaciens TaxID=2035 RepID=UPI001BDE790E|nr:helix-turn-helix transcriptional regulator [Curtobacterium flaccumfaciens]MBT1621777.1 PadR family transcriptional regulator [Curtobacterium flaccumfaciens pv. oortii]